MTFVQRWSWPLILWKMNGHTHAHTDTKSRDRDSIPDGPSLSFSLTLKGEPYQPQPLPSTPIAVICSNFSLGKAMWSLPPGWLLVSSRRSSQRRIKQLLDWEGHPWYLQTSFWEDRLPLGIWPQLHLKCQEATDVLIHQISTSGLEAGLKLNEVSWGQRKKEEEILFSCSSSENILWAFCWQNTLTAKSRISQSRQKNEYSLSYPELCNKVPHT